LLSDDVSHDRHNEMNGKGVTIVWTPALDCKGSAMGFQRLRAPRYSIDAHFDVTLFRATQGDR